MLKALFFCFLPLTALLCTAAEEATPVTENSPLARVDKKLPMLEFLPVGSVLKRVTFPRYEGARLSVLLTAESMKIKSEQEVTAYAMNIHLYGKTGQVTHFSSAQASYLPEKKLIVSPAKTTLKEERLSAEGTGLYLDTTVKRGFLTGPATTIISTAKKNK